MAYKNIAVDKSVHARAKVRAAMEGRPLGRIVAELLENWLITEDNKGEGENGGGQGHQRIMDDD